MRMGKKYVITPEDYPEDPPDYEDDPYYYDDGPWDWQREAHLGLCDRVAKGEIEITPELIQSVTDPVWKRELIEAICMRRVNTKEK